MYNGLSKYVSKCFGILLLAHVFHNKLTLLLLTFDKASQHSQQANSRHLQSGSVQTNSNVKGDPVQV